MNPDTIQLIDRLAAKLGTTADHLWSVLTKQAVIVAIGDFISAAIVVSAFIFWLRLVQKKTTPIKTVTEYSGGHKTEHLENDWDAEGKFFAWLGVYGLAIMSSVFIGSAIYSTITFIYNPEYFAFSKFVSLLGK